MPANKTRVMMWIAICACTTTSVEAGNCTLRNPDRQIYELFPKATSYRTVVGRIDSIMRSAIEQRFGGRLAFGDLGKHTICIVFREGVPIGVVHARTELGTQGSVEFVWAIDLAMKIKDFRVQRSRDNFTGLLRSDNFRNRLIGLDARQLRSLVSDANSLLDGMAVRVPEEAARMARLAVVSGAKTLLITDVAFGNTLHRARLLGHIQESFPETDHVTRIEDPFDSKTMAIVQRLRGSTTTSIDRDSFTALRSLDENGATLGGLACSRFLNASKGPRYWWAVTAEGRILKVWITGHDGHAVNAGLPELVGKNLDGVVRLSETPGESLGGHAVEVLAVFAAAGIGK